MRFFVAVVPTGSAVRELRSALTLLPDPGVAWTDPADWHLTLAFFGEVPYDRRPALSTALADLATRTGLVRLHLAGGGHFDSRVLWAGIDGDVEGLHALALGTREAAESANVDFDNRPYRPHLTLAFAHQRGKDATSTDSTSPPGAPDVRPLADALTHFSSTPWHADKLLLMSTRPGHSPSYTVEESWDLT